MAFVATVFLAFPSCNPNRVFSLISNFFSAMLLRGLPFLDFLSFGAEAWIAGTAGTAGTAVGSKACGWAQSTKLKATAIATATVCKCIMLPPIDSSSESEMPSGITMRCNGKACSSNFSIGSKTRPAKPSAICAPGVIVGKEPSVRHGILSKFCERSATTLQGSSKVRIKLHQASRSLGKCKKSLSGDSSAQQGL